MMFWGVRFLVSAWAPQLSLSAIDEEQQKYDKPKDQGKELVKMLTTWKGESQPIFIRATLPVELWQALLTLLQEFKDVFTWTYA